MMKLFRTNRSATGNTGFIKEIIEKKDASYDELIGCFEKVKANGDVAVIKLDGERDKNWYTILILFPGKKREMIRADESDLKKALKKVLTKYLSSNSDSE